MHQIRNSIMNTSYRKRNACRELFKVAELYEVEQRKFRNECVKANLNELNLKLTFHLNERIVMKICANNKCKKFKHTNDSIFINEVQVMKICKGCKTVYYCGRKCQKVDWKQLHRDYCQMLKEKICLL